MGLLFRKISCPKLFYIYYNPLIPVSLKCKFYSFTNKTTDKCFFEKAYRAQKPYKNFKFLKFYINNYIDLNGTYYDKEQYFK